MLFELKTLLPSTITKLEIAFIRVSILLIVKDIPKIIIIIDRDIVCSLSKREKKAKSEITCYHLILR